MSSRTNTRMVWLVGIFLGLILVPALVSAQEKIDPDKLYAEISGEWEFESDGQYLYVKFYAEDGKLYGMGTDDPSGTLCEPVEGEPMTFNAYHVNGNLYILKFQKDDDGKITICEMNLAGLEVMGKKIK